MPYTNHREAHVSAEIERIFEFIHRGRAAQAEVDKIIEEAGGREAGRHDIHPREGGGKRLPKRSARPRNKETHGPEPSN